MLAFAGTLAIHTIVAVAADALVVTHPFHPPDQTPPKVSMIDVTVEKKVDPPDPEPEPEKIPDPLPTIRDTRAAAAGRASIAASRTPRSLAAAAEPPPETIEQPAPTDDGGGQVVHVWKTTSRPARPASPCAVGPDRTTGHLAQRRQPAPVPARGLARARAT